MRIEIGTTELCANAVYVPPDTIEVVKWFLETDAVVIMTEEILHSVLYRVVGREACDTLHNIRNNHPYVFGCIIGRR